MRTSGGHRSYRASSRLDLTARADVFTQLGTMLNAGLPLDQALTTIAMGKGVAAHIASTMLPQVRGGQSLTVSGANSGLIDHFDQELLNRAELSGRIGPTLSRLGEWYGAKASRARRVKSKLTFPLSVLTLAAFVAPLPALFGGSLTGLEYLIGVLWFLGRVAAVGWVLWKLPTWLRDRGSANWWDQFRMQAPLFGAVHVRREVLSVLDAFEMMYTAGVDAERALEAACDNTTNGIIRSSFEDAHARLTHGMPLGETFAANVFLTQRTRQFVTTGDKSGSLTDMLVRNSVLESDEIESFDNQVADWTPRLVYSLIAVWMIGKILSGRVI